MHERARIHEVQLGHGTVEVDDVVGIEMRRGAVMGVNLPERAQAQQGSANERYKPSYGCRTCLRTPGLVVML